MNKYVAIIGILGLLIVSSSAILSIWNVISIKLAFQIGFAILILVVSLLFSLVIVEALNDN